MSVEAQLFGVLDWLLQQPRPKSSDSENRHEGETRTAAQL